MWHEAIHQRVAVVEQSVQLLGGLHGRGGVGAELLPLDRHRAAAGRRHALHLARHLWPGWSPRVSVSIDVSLDVCREKLNLAH